MENIRVTTTVKDTQAPITLTGAPGVPIQTGNMQFTSTTPVFDTATPMLTSPVVPLTGYLATPVIEPIAAPMQHNVTTTVTETFAAAPPPQPDTNLRPVERPENKAKLVSKPAPVHRAAPLPPVAPAATDFTTPVRYHNTTAHVADVAHDPRPLLPVDNEVHDFEVHREGAYSKGHTFPHAGVKKTADANRAIPGAHAGEAYVQGASGRHGPTVAPAGPGLYGPTGYAAPIGPGAEKGPRPHVHREGLVGTNVAGAVPGAAIVNDPRPPLHLEREVHDFEVHRQGGHAAGHTLPGVKPKGTYVGAVPAAVEVKGNTTNVIAGAKPGVAAPSTLPSGAAPSTRI